MNSMTRAFVNALKDIAECPICKDDFTDPRSLPCIHTFCLHCIARWGRDKRPGDAMDCPVCNQTFVYPAGGIEQLQKNYYVNKLLCIKVAGDIAAGTAAFCDRCETSEQGAAAAAAVDTAIAYCNRLPEEAV